MPEYHCHCGRCNGKAVSKSTFYDHRQRRLEENVAVLQPDLIHHEEHIEDSDLEDMGELSHD